MEEERLITATGAAVEGAPGLCLSLLLRFMAGGVYGTHHHILYDEVGRSPLQERRDTHWYLFFFFFLPVKPLLENYHNTFEKCFIAQTGFIRRAPLRSAPSSQKLL